MKLELDSVGDSSPQTYLAVRRNGAVTGHAVGSDGSAVREREVVLRFVVATWNPALYVSKGVSENVPTLHTRRLSWASPVGPTRTVGAL